MNKHKWDWLEKRISDCGLTKSSFAKNIDWSITRVSEMINGLLVNDGKYRNFPQDKVRIAAEVLDIPFENLYEYNIGNTDIISFQKSQTNIVDEIDIERLLAIFDAVDETLSQIRKKLPERSKFELVIKFYNAGYGKSDDASVDTDDFRRALKLVVNG